MRRQRGHAAIGGRRPPRGLTEQARADWAALARPTATPERFEPATTAALPEPVRRWLDHAIAPGYAAAHGGGVADARRDPAWGVAEVQRGAATDARGWVRVGGDRAA